MFFVKIASGLRNQCLIVLLINAHTRWQNARMIHWLGERTFLVQHMKEDILEIVKKQEKTLKVKDICKES
jgi:hypothetical protein